MANLPSIPQLKTGLSTVNALVLVSPQATVGYQPQPFTFNGSISAQQPYMLFHYEGENVANIESDVTDHFVEDNTAIQDQVALKPVTVRVQGFIGELLDFVPETDLTGTVAGYAQIAAQKFQLLSSYTPGLSITALNAYNEAFQTYQLAAETLQSAQSAISSINNLVGNTQTSNVIDGLNIITDQPNQSRQQQYFQQFYAYWAARTLFTIQTPWAIFTDMIIKSLKAIQTADSVSITDFEIEFKQLRFASTSVTDSANVPWGRLGPISATPANNGNIVATVSPTTSTQMISNLG